MIALCAVRELHPGEILLHRHADVRVGLVVLEHRVVARGVLLDEVVLEHQRFGFPNSENDVPEVLAFLRELKKNGFFDAQAPYTLTFEIKPWTGEDVDTVIANAKRTLNRAWALLED